MFVHRFSLVHVNMGFRFGINTPVMFVNLNFRFGVVIISFNISCLVHDLGGLSLGSVILGHL